jgi:TRAP-type C4-dicarboxylate transport system permease small subunit
MMRSIEKWIGKCVLFVLALQGFALMVIIGIEVMYRYVLGHALSWPEEVAGIVFVWYTLLGIAVVLQEDSHISFDFLLKRFPSPVVKGLSLFSLLIIMGYAGFMIFYGTSYARMFSFQTTPATNINLLWLNLSLPLSGGCIVIFALLKAVDLFGPQKEQGTHP